MSDRDGGIVRVAGAGSREKDESPGVPALVMAAEHYNRVLRLVQKKQDVELELDVKVSWHDDDPDGYNTLGRDPRHGGGRRGGDGGRAPRLLALRARAPPTTRPAARS